MAGWCYHHAMAKRAYPYLGCDLPRYLRTIPSAAGCQRSRFCGRSSGKIEGREVCRAICHTPLCSCCSRDNRSLWTRSALILLGAWPAHQRGVRRGVVIPLPTPKDYSDHPEENTAVVKGTSPVGSDLTDIGLDLCIHFHLYIISIFY